MADVSTLFWFCGWINIMNSVWCRNWVSRNSSLTVYSFAAFWLCRFLQLLYVMRFWKTFCILTLQKRGALFHVRSFLGRAALSWRNGQCESLCRCCCCGETLSLKTHHNTGGLDADKGPCFLKPKTRSAHVKQNVFWPSVSVKALLCCENGLMRQM